MNRNNNTKSLRRNNKRYNPGGGFFRDNAIVITIVLVALVSFVLGGFSFLGVYRLVNPMPEKETEEIEFVTPGEITDSAATTDTQTQGQQNPSLADKLICIDPGHGFNDPGTVNVPYMQGKSEADFNFIFATHLKEELEAIGFKVMFTYDGKSIPAGFDYDGDNIFSASDNFNGEVVSERRDYAMSLKPDYFISIHCDSFATDESVHGMRIYALDTNEHASKAIDKIVSRMAPVTAKYENTTARKFLKDSDNAFAVTKKWTNTPAMLVELGFVTNKSDADCLLSEEWNKSVAAAIAKGITDYFS